jgi:putative acyl-CoA dehydrogenase
MATHEVLNQAPDLPEYDLSATDPVLLDGVRREGAGWAGDLLGAFGKRLGTDEVREWGFLANRNPPVLHTHDRAGRRVDLVEYHPAYHDLMRLSVANGVHCLALEDPLREGGHVARTALMYLDAQVEQGHGCPISMSSSVAASLRHQPDVAAEWIPRVATRTYDPRLRPVTEKAGVLMGMGMTEKQGGSDVRANTSVAVPADGGGYRLTGHKWFTSAPMCDAFLVLARAPGGLTCFLLPRFTPDGEVNPIHVMRLKDKLGNRSNASGEIEFDGAWARIVGEEGRGVRTIIEMVNGTRLDCVIASAAMMRQAVTQAAHHVAHRSAFGRPLIDQPLMRTVVADLEVEAEAAALLMLRVAGAFDRAASDEQEAHLQRILTPVAKYWVTKRCSGVVAEAMECLGGNGYVEDSIMPRLYREAPVNAIWEGSGNVIALDVLRAMVKEPASVEAFRLELKAGRGADRRLDAAIDRLETALSSPGGQEQDARRLVQDMAVAVTGSLAVRFGPPGLGTAYCASRLDPQPAPLYGSLPAGVDRDRLLAAARAV